MTTNATNAVSSFFYYMWNAWSENECRHVFGHMHSHFWAKWTILAEINLRGAAERFYAELSDDNRRKLVERATEIYDGAKRRTVPTAEDTGEILAALANSMQELYKSVCKKVNASGGILYTFDQSCDTINSTEYLSDSCDEIAERIVAGLRVKDGDLQIFSVGSKNINVTEKDLADPELEHEWLSLKNNYEVMYNQTLLNIALNIDQYINRS